MSLLQPGGMLYISFPVGRRRVEFNAQRVFAPADILDWLDGRLDLTRFDYVNDAGNLVRHAALQDAGGLHNGCGIYLFSRGG